MGGTLAREGTRDRLFDCIEERDSVCRSHSVLGYPLSRDHEENAAAQELSNE